MPIIWKLIEILIFSIFIIFFPRYGKGAVQIEKQPGNLTQLFILHRKYENDNLLAFKAAHRHQISPLLMQLHVMRNEH